MHMFGSAFVNIMRLWHRIKAKVFSILISGAFAKFGKNSVIVPPLKFGGERRIAIGNTVYIEGGSWIQTLPECKEEIGLSIGNNVSIGASSLISAGCKIVIEDNVLMAPNVCIVDHIHAYSDVNRPIRVQGITKCSPVVIGQSTWIGQNVVILPGVTIGKHCIIGANSVVNKSIPDYSLAIGAPAKVISAFNSATGQWDKVQT